MKKIIFILTLLFTITFTGKAESIVSTKCIDDNIETIVVNFPSTICFYKAPVLDCQKITVKVEDDLDKDIITNDINYKIKGNKLSIDLENYYPTDSTRFNDPSKVKIYIPIQFINNTESKYISFKKNDSGNTN